MLKTVGRMWKKAREVLLGLRLNHVEGNRKRSRMLHVDDDDHSLPPSLLNCDDLSSSFHAFPLSKSISKQSCSICLTKMKQGCGHAIFIAECSHSFHFHCIASNVKPGNQRCPVCRTKWKQIPLSGINQNNQHDSETATIRHLPLPLPPPPYCPPERSMFDDDEPINDQCSIPQSKTSSAADHTNVVKSAAAAAIEIKTYPEISSVPRFNTHNNFTILVHIKASAMNAAADKEKAQWKQVWEARRRAPIDLVTVLDISGSMAGTKLALVKRAMRFVIQNLGPNDRLSVVAFSSSARRLFHLRRMSDSGRQQSITAVNSLVANGGTNILEGLRKSAKIMEDRKEKNPVASIMLLSDGRDNYNSASYGGAWTPPDSLGRDKTGSRIPVHTFGFGADHDAWTMHSVSEISGGTFSFVESEDAIQDAFAQCIGGLMSVVVQCVQVRVECVDRSLGIVSINAGSYPSQVKSGGNRGVVDFGDLYADEERDFLVSVNLPGAAKSCGQTSLIKVKCVYRDSETGETEQLETEELKIGRPEVATGEAITSVEVDRQRNRLRSAEAMEEARAVAEQGDLAGAVVILEDCRKKLLESVSYKSMDRLCVALDAELKEMQERMASRRAYEESGRAYMLSGMCSHLGQRATARGYSTDSSSVVQVYQTSSMVDMISRSSKDMLLGSSGSSDRPLLFPFRSQPKPR